MSNHRSRATLEQQKALVDFLEQHPDLVCGRAKNGKALWHVLAKKLNAVEGGVKKPSRNWAKTWFDKKCTLKKIIAKQKSGKHMKIRLSHVDLRIFSILQQCGEISPDIELNDTVESTISGVIGKTEKLEDEESLRSSPTLPSEEELETNDNYTFEYLDASDCPQTNTEIEHTYSKKIMNSYRRNSESNTLQMEFDRVASLEEKRIQIEQQSSTARQETSEAIRRCAIAIESLAGAVNYQGAVISEALRTQGETLAEALKAQGKMIADALAKR